MVNSKICNKYIFKKNTQNDIFYNDKNIDGMQFIKQYQIVKKKQIIQQLLIVEELITFII